MAIIRQSKQSNRVRIQQRKSGQFTLTLPKVLAQAYELEKGIDCEWVIIERGLLLKKLEK